MTRRVTAVRLPVLVVLLLSVANRSARAWDAADDPSRGQEPALQAATAPVDDPPSDGLAAFLATTKIAVDLDTYDAWNTNRPIGRVNLLRAYDVSNNSFSLNQAGIIVDHPPDAAHRRRAGLRVDLMVGQATGALQGSAANELRPEIYRPIFQAYGSYVFPLGSGVQVDVGKFASALGIENNYTKDQLNYSRSYFFAFLPSYHMGARTSYSPSAHVTLGWWIVNGAQQTEDFNGGKSQAATLTLKPTASVTWNLSYYAGREGRDPAPLESQDGAVGAAPSGLPADAVTASAGSRLQIVDAYLTWNASGRLTVAAEGDDITVRSTPARQELYGGAAYLQYRAKPDVHLAARTEYMSDRGGLFSGAGAILRETTATATWWPDPHFMIRGEWRRDGSSRPLFPTDRAGVRRDVQQTLTLGLVWWIGNKDGVW